jgi:hypothetical protein
MMGLYLLLITKAVFCHAHTHTHTSFPYRYSTATRYELHCWSIESWWRLHFRHLSRLALGPTQPPIQWVPHIFPGGKAAGALRQPSNSSSVEVKEGVALYHNPYPPGLHGLS